MDPRATLVRPLLIERGERPPLPARVFAHPDHQGAATLILAHGAGAPQAHPFMVRAAEALASRGLTVVTFDFPYTVAGRRLPDKAPVLEQAWIDVIGWARTQDGLPGALAIGGKSMGGRMASHVAAHHAAAAGDLVGLVFLGYPLHPPATPAQRRDAHLPLIRRPMLFVQGSRDAFGTPEELRPILASLEADVSLHVVEGADHGFSVARRTPAGDVPPARRGVGASTPDVLTDTWEAVARWVRERVASPGDRHR